MTQLTAQLTSMDPDDVADLGVDYDVQVFSSFELVRDAWIDLQEDAYSLGFQQFNWLSAVWETVGHTRSIRPVIVLVSDNAGKPMMLIPLAERRRNGLRVLEFIDYELCDYNAPLIRHALIRELGHSGFRKLWTRILAQAGPVDAVRLEKMPPLIGDAENPFLQLGVRQHASTFQASLAGDLAYGSTLRLFRHPSLVVSMASPGAGRPSSCAICGETAAIWKSWERSS